MDRYDVIVAGEGVAGLAASLACAREGLSVLSLEPAFYGGLVSSVNDLVDPGADLEGSGIDVATQLAGEAMDAGVARLPEAAVALRAEGDAWRVVTDQGEHEARCVVVATGAARRQLPLPGLERFEGKGLSWCADCDAPLLAGTDVVVVGGGDSALQEAAVLVHHARMVHLVHRGRDWRARAALREAFARALDACPGRCVMHLEHAVLAVEGDEAIAAVVLQGPDGSRRTLQAGALFPCIGLEPRVAWTGLATDASGALACDAGGSTTAPGVFAAGAVRAGFGGRLRDALVEASALSAAIARRCRPHG
jgi:thioredoxin reductase (NADPH)